MTGVSSAVKENGILLQTFYLFLRSTVRCLYLFSQTFSSKAEPIHINLKARELDRRNMAGFSSSRSSSQNLQFNTPDLKFHPQDQDIIKNGSFHNLTFELEKANNNGKPLLRVSQEYLTSPRKHKNDALLEESDAERQSNSFLIVPFLNLFHWTLLVPNGIKYDKDRGRFFMEKASPLIKILSYGWLLCLSVYLTLFLLMDLDQRLTVKVITGKIIWGCYTLFDITAIACLRTNGDRLAKLLTDGNSVCHCLHLIVNKDDTRKKRRCTCKKYAIWIASGITLVYALFFMVFVMTELTASTSNFYNIFLNLTRRTNEGEGESGAGGNYVDLYYPCTSEKQVLCNLVERITDNFYAAILLIIWFFMAFSVELIWIAFLLMTATCGYYFKAMITDCIRVIENGQVDLLQGIRIYTKISLLLEDFNKIFGNTLLWIVKASILYQAATFGEFLAGCSNGFMFDFVNILGFVPFIATVYTASEVHRAGQILPSLIKKQFLNMEVITDYEQTLRMIQGSSVVQFDALSNSVGFKGAGFFTISYTFVGSMIGLIITYSLVTVQFKLNEIILG